MALSLQSDMSPASVRLRFCGSSSEVVKHVVSGLASIGACDRSALENWLPQVLPDSLAASGEEALERVVRILPLDIPLVPSDPVIVPAELRPEVSELGRVLKAELPTFFLSLDDPPFTLEGRAKDEFYDRLLADLEMLDALSRASEDVP